MNTGQPFTTALVPETWMKIGSGIDRETSLNFVQVARNKDGHATTWKLMLTTNANGKTDWRAASHSTSQGVTVEYPRPRNLSHSHIDTHLRRMCQEGEWVGTEWSPA